jgi:ACS family sodium-dependent inorganic phosphate cotransporter
VYSLLKTEGCVSAWVARGAAGCARCPFLRDVVGLSLTQAGFFAAVPQLLLIAVSLVSARTADRLLRPGGRCFQRTGLVRKTFTATALLPTAAGLLLLGLLGPQLSEGVTLGVLACLSGMGGIETGGGYSVNHLDIAPANAGVVQSVKNMFGQATGCKSSLRGFASRSEQTRQCSCCRSN